MNNCILHLADHITVYTGFSNQVKAVNPIVDTFIAGLNGAEITSITKGKKAVGTCHLFQNGESFSWSSTGEYICILIEPGILKFDQDMNNISETLLTMVKDKRILGSNMAYILEGYFQRIKQASESDKRINKVTNHIKKNPQLKIGNEDLSEIAHLSTSRLMTLFKETKTVNIKKYTTWIKIKHCLKLMQEGESIAKACKETGFFDNAHFTKAFKNTIGISPIKYMKAIRTPLGNLRYQQAA